MPPQENSRELRRSGHGCGPWRVYSENSPNHSKKVFSMARAKRVSRILLVNGDNTVQHLRALMLRMEGHHVDTAADLHAARAVLAVARKYNLIIVDVGHFAGPGLDFCEEIKKKYSAQKVLMQVDGSTCSSTATVARTR